jgi:TatD DNase family protein
MEKLPFIDSHFHLLEMEKKNININDILHLFSDILSFGIDIGIKPSDFKTRIQKYTYPANILKSSGLYPGLVESPDLAKEKEILQLQLDNNQIDAIGEAGLDWHWDYGTRDNQIQLFAWQAELAQTYGIPLIVHNRLADDDLADVFTSLAYKGKILLHCYSGNLELMNKMLHFDCYFSFAGNITYKKSDSIRKTLIQLPKDRILFETDSPYLSPVPLRGKNNIPENVALVYEFAAGQLDISLPELAAITERNFKKLFTV